MLFLKHFNVLDQTLLGVGKIHVHVSQTIAVLCQTLVDKMGFSGRTQLCWTQFPWHVTPAPQRLTTRVCRIPQEHGVSTRHDDFATKIIHQAASVAELAWTTETFCASRTGWMRTRRMRDAVCYEARCPPELTVLSTHLFAQVRLWRRRPGRDRLRLLPLDVGGDDELSQVRPLLDVLPTLVP